MTYNSFRDELSGRAAARNGGTTVGHVEELEDQAVVTVIFEEISLSRHKITSPPELDINTELSASKRRQVVDLAEYCGCFATSAKVRQTPVAKHRIVTDGNVHAVQQSPYRVSLKERDFIQKLIQERLDDDIIQPSSSPWASPIVLVKRKDETLRYCVDNRRLKAEKRKISTRFHASKLL